MAVSFRRLLLLASTFATSVLARTLVDPAVYNNLVHYATVVITAGTVPCADPPFDLVSEAFIQNTVTDTQAVIYRDPTAKEIILTIPGTASLEDVLTDVAFVPLPYSNQSCVGCLVHVGFQTAWLSIQADVESNLNSLRQTYPDYRFLIVGYSLGGALANLAFGALKPIASLNIVSAYSYGEPRVGNDLYANYIDSLSGASDTNPGIYFRTTHANDGVPQLPPTLLGFRHHRNEYWEMDGPNGTAPTVATTYRCDGQEPLDCNNSQFGIATNAAHGSYVGFSAGNCTG